MSFEYQIWICWYISRWQYLFGKWIISFVHLVFMLLLFFVFLSAITRSNCFHTHGHESPCYASTYPYVIMFGLMQVILSQNMVALHCCCNHVSIILFDCHWSWDSYNTRSSFYLILNLKFVKLDKALCSLKR